MTRPCCPVASLPRCRSSERGITVIELLVATAVFALFIIVVDAVFFSANRSSRKAELAADTQQNARIANERLTREIRESRPAEIVVNNSVPGHSAIVFKSARLNRDNSVFCLYVRTETEPLFNRDCFDDFTGGDVPEPPYTPPEPVFPRGSYQPIWQRRIVYYVVDTPDGLHTLHRRVDQLGSATDGLPDPATLMTGGDVIASMVESFDVTLVGGEFRVTLKVKGTQVIQGVAIPDQEVLLPGTVLIRN